MLSGISQFEKEQFGISSNVGVTSNPGYMAHFQDSLELFYLKSGNYRVKVNGASYELHGGDMAVILPYQVHEYINVDSTNKELVILLNTNLMDDYRSRLENCGFKDPIIRKEQMPQQLVNLLFTFEKIGIKEDDEEELALLRKHLGNAVMWYIFKIIPLKRSGNGRLSVIQNFTKFLYNNYSNGDLKLEDIAKKLGYNCTYLSNAINIAFGMNFKSVLNTIRIREAKKLVAHSDKTITEICHQCGFNSVRTFNRAFLNFEGMPPREYREAHNSVEANGNK